MKKPDVRPETLCLAPWTHTYLSPQLERRQCCASRESAQNFKQYIDTESGTGEFNPLTLSKWWNGEHMKSVRRRMMNGEALPECEVCNGKLLNTSVYRSYFSHLFSDVYDKIWDNTTDDGETTLPVVSWDYRYSNICNFKCRMCGDMLSSAWEREAVNNQMVDYSNPKNNWLLPQNRELIKNFTSNTIVPEFMDAVEAKTIREIYWVGGEPLLYEQHWDAMSRIIELNYAEHVRVRYNTNLSQINYKKRNLYELLKHFGAWEICASLDGTGAIGEYIRTGLNYNSWLENFKLGLEKQHNPRQMRIDFTLTLPGMAEVSNIVSLARQLDCGLLTKVVFTFSSDIMMSPLILPKEILHGWIYQIQNEIRPYINHQTQSMWDVLEQLKTRPTLSEIYGDQATPGALRGKQHILKLENLRKDATITMNEILQTYRPAHEWWNKI